MKVLIADKVSQTAVDLINAEEEMTADVKTGLSEDEIINIIKDYEGLIVRSATKVTKKIIESGKNLKIIGRAGVGYDNIDIPAATNAGIIVMNTPFGNINSAAEHTMAMILALSRHIHKAHHSLKNRKEWDRKRFVGIELKNKTIGIIGLGKIGKIVAGICQGFKLNIIAYDPFIDAETMEKINVKKVQFDVLLKTSDFITVHMILTDKTRNIIDKPQFELMKNNVRIINVGRGGLINEKALYDAINSRKVNGAAIDVWENEPSIESPLLELDDILATPHLGASTIEAQENVAIDIAHQMIDGLKKGILINVVNKL